jgi:hypothetical protein
MSIKKGLEAGKYFLEYPDLLKRGRTVLVIDARLKIMGESPCC